MYRESELGFTAKTAKDKFVKVLDFTQEIEKQILHIGVKPENAKKVIELMYNEPIVTRNKIAEIANVKLTTVNGIVNAFLENGIIKETTGYSRNQVFAFQKYINLFLK